VTKNTYKIQNVATEGLPHPLYLTLKSGGVICKWDQPGLSVWTIVKHAAEDGYGYVLLLSVIRVLINLAVVFSLPVLKQLKIYISL
jgi:hypothetical protein